MESASRAFHNAVRKSMRQVRTVIGATTIDPKLLTAAEQLLYEGYQNDARGRAKLVQVGWYREVKSQKRGTRSAA